MPRPRKALLVDDHALFREGLALLLAQSFEGVECVQAASIGEALALAEQHQDLTLTLLDLGLPDSDGGLPGLRRLQQALPGPALVVLSADDAPQTVLETIRAGAQGFIPKSARPAQLREALAHVLSGGIYLPPQAMAGVAANEPVELSDRQLDVLRLLIQGRPNKLICRELGLSESTVKTHLAAVFRKLDVNTRTQAVVKAAALGLRL
ncbi:response regulator transcription factor [Pelomonas sp. KK5]|uniref:LuxR C-terminal-related transcriptional regulator n=1 Tax=Pelomonas sp. KK5 TaxID=1855730 RepID=UPI00097BFA4B|nr:response regulator transcription factor [Pelomonas sp. KK5]